MLSAAAPGRWSVLILVAALGLGALAWRVSDRVEQDNEFCLSCHLDPDTRLHAAIGEDFRGRPPASLAAQHAGVGVDGRGDGAFRCIDCHGGVSWPGRVRIKLLALGDALQYAIGHFEEPAGMRWPLWDEDCRQCHTEFEAEPSQPWEIDRFHEIPLHNEGLGVACVACHRVHDEAGDPERHFLAPEHLATQCRSCHGDLFDGPG